MIKKYIEMKNQKKDEDKADPEKELPLPQAAQ
jgi:hypothetical protein